jgi:hypothetical protein
MYELSQECDVQIFTIESRLVSFPSINTRFNDADALTTLNDRRDYFTDSKLLLDAL